MRKVSTTFVTPYDREDIYGMFGRWTTSLTPLITLVGSSLTSRCSNCRLNSSRAPKAREDERASTRRDRKYIKPNKMEKALFAVNEYENALDTAYRRMLRDALAPGNDPIAALKVKILADSVEKPRPTSNDSRALSIAAIKRPDGLGADRDSDCCDHRNWL